MSIPDKIFMLQTLYIPLLEAFLKNDLTAEEFVEIYLEKRLDDHSVSPKKEIYDTLGLILGDVDTYWPNADPSEWPTEIGEDELRRNCTENLAKLKAFVQEYEAQS